MTDSRKAHYIRFKEDGEWQTALVETLTAKNVLTHSLEKQGTPYEYRGRVSIPEADGQFVQLIGKAEPSPSSF
jgi:hypothetical protein